MIPHIRDQTNKKNEILFDVKEKNTQQHPILYCTELIFKSEGAIHIFLQKGNKLMV